MSTNERNQNNQIVQLSTCPILLSLCPCPHPIVQRDFTMAEISALVLFSKTIWYFGTLVLWQERRRKFALSFYWNFQKTFW